MAKSIYKNTDVFKSSKTILGFVHLVLFNFNWNWKK